MPTQDGRPLRRYKRRWKIERLFAWLFNFRRLVVRYEFHRDPPQGGGNGAVMFIRRFCDHGSKALEQQPENGLALAFGPAQSLGAVVEDGASGSAFETAPGTVIEFISWLTGRSHRLKDHATIAGKEDKIKKAKSKPNEPSTAEPAS